MRADERRAGAGVVVGTASAVLTGSVAVGTGAASGIGRAISLACATGALFFVDGGITMG